MRGPCSALYDGRFTLDFELQINKRSSTKKKIASHILIDIIIALQL